MSQTSDVQQLLYCWFSTSTVKCCTAAIYKRKANNAQQQDNEFEHLKKKLCSSYFQFLIFFNVAQSLPYVIMQSIVLKSGDQAGTIVSIKNDKLEINKFSSKTTVER